MPRLQLVLSLLITLAAVPTFRADVSLGQVQRAQTMLGPDIWSQIIRIENTAPASRYPRRLHALVFELSGILWFYTPVDGTQSFSLHEGRLAEEKADFGPLLRDIDPGFVRWTEVRPRGAGKGLPAVALGNGCFVESVAELRARLARGEPMERPRLLSYYSQLPTGLNGHTVLVFGKGAAVEVFDPSRPHVRPFVPKGLARDALAVARSIDGGDVVKARYVELALGTAAVEAMIATAGSRSHGVVMNPDKS